MPLLFVTGNKHKFEELSNILEKEYSFKVGQAGFAFRELESESLEEIAVDKARQAFERLHVPLFVEDTGLYFKAYKNFPGNHAKRIFDSIEYEGIFRLLKRKSRTAVFQTCLCYIDARTIKVFSEKLEGKIAEKVVLPKKKAFDYDRVFVPKDKTMAIVQMTLEEKNSFSHRGKVTRMLGSWLEEKAKTDFIDSIQ